MSNMDNMENIRILPGIKSIGLALADAVTLTENYAQKNSCMVAGSFQEIRFAPLASFTLSPAVVKGQLVYEYKVEGKVIDGDSLLAWNGVPVCGKVVDVYDNCYLLGSSGKPYATCSVGLSIEDHYTGKRYVPLKFEFKSLYPLKTLG